MTNTPTMAFEFFDILPRSAKPRETGLTFTGDRGRTLREIEELVDCAGDFIDMIKLSMTSARLQSRQKVKEKIALYRENAIDVFPGGMMTELAVLQNCVTKYLDECEDLGFNVLEVSSTDTCIPLDTKVRLVEMAVARGFKVLGELGSHFQETAPGVAQTVYEARQLLDAGAWKVIIEGAAVTAAKGKETEAGQALLYPIVAQVGLDNLIFESHEPYALIQEFGPEVSVGNAGSAGNIWYIEMSRRGISPRIWFGKMAVLARSCPSVT